MTTTVRSPRPVRRALAAVALALLPALAFAGCGDEGTPPAGGAAGGGTPAAATTATKDAVIAHLRATLAAIEAEDWDAAAAHFHMGPRAPKPAEFPEAFRGMVAKREISAAGIDVLAAKGTFGSLAEVFPERGASWAERAGVPLDRCYALAHGDGEVAVYLGEGGLQLIRLDDVGKLR